MPLVLTKAATEDLSYSNIVDLAIPGTIYAGRSQHLDQTRGSTRRPRLANRPQ
jgi:hypothetical protein